MRRLLSVLAASVVLSACSSGSGVTSDTGRHCADLLARAVSSPYVAVPGAFACQSATLAAEAQSAGVTNDADIQTYAKTLGFTSDHFVGATGDGGYTYEVTGANLAAVLTIWTGPDGLVVAFERSSRP